MAVKLGVIGTGTVAQDYHLKRWHDLKGAQVTAVCDLDRAKAEAVGARLGAKVYDSHRSLIEEADVDALYIFVPPFAHTDQELLACRRKLPFFVEKPIALSMEKAREIEAAVRESGVITSVGYNWRYMRTTNTAREIVGNAKVGIIMGYWFNELHTQKDHWWNKMALSGGQMVEQATHIVDLLRYFGGDAASVYARQARRLVDVEDFDIYDVANVTVEFESGAVGTISTGCVMPQGWKAGIEVQADGVMFELTPGKLRVTKPDVVEEYITSWHPLQNEYLIESQAFVDAVASGDRTAIKSPYADAVKTLAISLAANESARTGKVVALRQ